MFTVKKEIAKNLFNALFEANNADCTDIDNENDLDYGLSRQTSLYGMLSTCIIELGYEEELRDWIENGERPRFCFD